MPVKEPDYTSYKPVPAWSSDAALKMAYTEGIEVYAPGSNVLTLDFDDDKSYAEFKERLSMFTAHFVVESVIETESRTPGHKHVYVVLNKGLIEEVRLAAQAILGSDWRRELFSLKRATEFDPEPILTFERPGSGADKVPGLRLVQPTALPEAA